MNFIVVLILALITFSLGLVLIVQWKDSSTDITQQQQDYILERLAKLACNSRERVCLSNNFESVTDELHIVGVHVRNDAFDKKRFILTFEPKRDPSGDVDDFADVLIVTRTDELLIDPKTQDKYAAVFQIDPRAKKGEYTIDVTVADATGDLDPIRDRIVFTVK